MQREVLILTGQASITQEGSTVNGERIEYFMQEQRVKASAGAARSGSSRVQMVIQPRHAQTQQPATPASPDTPPPPAVTEDGNDAP